EKNLSFNQPYKTEFVWNHPSTNKPTSPYWLEEKGSLGMYKVPDENLTGSPEAPPQFVLDFVVTIAGQKFQFQKPIVYKYNDAEKGETYKPCVVVPKAWVSMGEKVLVFSESKSKKVWVKVKAFTHNLSGELRLNVPNDWKIQTEKQNVSLAKSGDTQTYWFEVFPPKNQSETVLIPELKVRSQIFDKDLIEINYSHIPEQKVLLSGG